MIRITAFLGIILAGLLTTSAQSSAESTAVPSGERVTVEGVVVEVARPDSGYIYLNFGGKFPNHTGAAWIHKQETKHFPDIDATVGKAIRVTGIAEILDGKQIVRIRKPEDLTILPDDSN